MTRIKCCGMTRVEDVVLAAQWGADAIGVIFTERSERCVSIGQARAMVKALPPFVSVVALFMDDEPALVQEVIDRIQPDLLQFHGREEDAWCQQFGRRYLKAIGMRDAAQGLAKLHDYPGASGLVLDGHGLGEAGGGGQRFDWSQMPKDLKQPLILAGGLTSANVGHAIRTARPWAVDVSSGIEVEAGIKDPARMHAFIEAVRSAL